MVEHLTRIPQWGAGGIVQWQRTCPTCNRPWVLSPGAQKETESTVSYNFSAHSQLVLQYFSLYCIIYHSFLGGESLGTFIKQWTYLCIFCLHSSCWKNLDCPFPHLSPLFPSMQLTSYLGVFVFVNRTFIRQPTAIHAYLSFNQLKWTQTLMVQVAFQVLTGYACLGLPYNATQNQRVCTGWRESLGSLHYWVFCGCTLSTLPGAYWINGWRNDVWQENE